MNDFSMVIQIRWKIGFSVTPLHHISTKLCTCQDSTAVMPCAKFHSDHFTTTWMGAEWNFHRIWILRCKNCSWNSPQFKLCWCVFCQLIPVYRLTHIVTIYKVDMWTHCIGLNFCMHNCEWMWKRGCGSGDECWIKYDRSSSGERGWVGLWGFLWWAPSAKRKDHHKVSSGWSSVWHRSNTGLSSTQYEQIPIILGVWPFWLTPFFFRSITFWRAYG